MLDPKLLDTDGIPTQVHELTHALGFTETQWGNFRLVDDELNWRGPVTNQTQPYQAYSEKVTGVECTRRSVQSGGCYSRILLQTPRVTQAARRQFKCPTLGGAELEDEGDAGSRGSHWEKRLFREEIMGA